MLLTPTDWGAIAGTFFGLVGSILGILNYRARVGEYKVKGKFTVQATRSGEKNEILVLVLNVINRGRVPFLLDDLFMIFPSSQASLRWHVEEKNIVRGPIQILDTSIGRPMYNPFPVKIEPNQAWKSTLTAENIYDLASKKEIIDISAFEQSGNNFRIGKYRTRKLRKQIVKIGQLINSEVSSDDEQVKTNTDGADLSETNDQ